MPAEISGTDVDLRKLVETHALAIVEGISASLPELRPWFPWAQTAPTAEEQIKRANNAVEAFAAAQDFEYSLFEADSNELVGGLRLNPLLAPGTAEIGYWVRSDRHRRGYATQAVRLATDTAFNHFDSLLKVEIHMECRSRESVRRVDGCALHRRPARKQGVTVSCNKATVIVWLKETYSGGHQCQKHRRQ